MRGLIRLTPSAMICYSFLALMGAGAGLLKLPGISTGEPLSWVDAFFMATSAVCVTGLSVVQPGADLTPAGQYVLLLLIQLGGLNIMTFSLFFMLALGNASMTTRLTADQLTREEESHQLLKSLGWVFGMTFIVEAAGTAFFYWRMHALEPEGARLFPAFFHAVSAFCNSGFSLYAGSLERFSDDPLILSGFMALIVAGGLGFIVINEIRVWVSKRVRRKEMRLSLHTRLVLTVTVLLLVAGAVVIGLLEQNNRFAGMSQVDQAVHSLFLSVTSRTAGFHTVETAALSDATLFFIIILMFIGGAPGSTSGGIKVTTLAILYFMLRSRLSGNHATHAWQRKIPEPTAKRAIAIFAGSFVFVNLCLLVLLIIERFGVPHAVKSTFLDELFEIVSAFGTVGLSTGNTGALSTAGRLLVTFVMFAGRVGPLTIALALAGRNEKPVSYEYAEEDVEIG